MRLIDFFDKGVERDPQRAFLVDEATSRTYYDSQLSSHRVANAILDAGFGPGSKVAVLSQNSALAFEAILGAMRAGCVWLPVNARSLTSEIVEQLSHAEVELLFYGGSFSASVPQFREHCPSLRAAVSIDLRDDPNGPWLGEWVGRDVVRKVDLPYQPDDLAGIHYTGGTSGKSKGVMHSHRSYAAMTVNTQLDLGYESPVFLVTAPMTHAAGLFVLTSAHLGATNIVLSKFDPLRTMQAIEHHRVTHLFLPPTAIYMMLAHPDVRKYDYSSLYRFIYAGAPMFLEKLVEAIDVFGPVMCQGYGQTEALPNVTFLPPSDHRLRGSEKDKRHLASCGRATLLSRVTIRDDEGRVLAPEEWGEICVQSSARMVGYYKDPALTEETLRDGWLHTGDVGFLDEDGYLYIVDRKKDMIITGGFNVYPSEIEQVLSRHPSVLDCAVIGVPDEKWGEAVKAVVEPKPGVQVSLAELESFCRAHLSGVKVPKSFETCATLPRSPVGKVLKRELRDRYWIGRERNV